MEAKCQAVMRLNRWIYDCFASMPAAKKKNQTDSADLPIRVLIIDDDEAHGQTVAECLERAGSECTVAASGQQGAQLIESETYDVVITDLKMEGIAATLIGTNGLLLRLLF